MNEALFYSIVKEDFSTAKKMLSAGANPNAIFEIEKKKFVSTFNLFISKTALVGQKKGSANSQYKAYMDLMKDFMQKSSLECRCLKQHKCPLYIALETFKIAEEKQILEGKCDIVRYLIINGASIKFDEKQGKKSDKPPNVWRLNWFDIEGIRSYLITKNFTYKETKIENE